MTEKVMKKQEEIREGVADFLTGNLFMLEQEFGDGSWTVREKALEEADEILSYLDSQGGVLLEERTQRYSEQTGQPIEATPYKILTSLI